MTSFTIGDRVTHEFGAPGTIISMTPAATGEWIYSVKSEAGLVRLFTADALRRADPGSAASSNPR